MRKWPGKKVFIRRFAPVLTMAVLLPCCFAAAFVFTPDWQGIAERAALTSAMVNMPEGSLALLERRFADKQDPYYESEENDVTPYMSPWTEPEQPSVSHPADDTPSPPPASSSKPQGAGGTASRPSEPIAPAPAAEQAKNIPKEYEGTIVQENLAGFASNLIACGAGTLRNYTETPDSEVKEVIAQGLNIKLEDTTEPQVLIVHTHTTESYEPLDSEIYDTRNTWRDTDNTNNMAAVGDVLEKTLREGGIGVVHDKTQHDYPSYNGAYDRSAETIRGYLEKYPTIKIVLDVHRDAILRADDVTVKPVVEVDGKKAAQLMIITGCEDGTMNVPLWRENLRFASSLQDMIEQKYPQLTRPIFFCYRKYNMDLTTGSLLLEFGSNANTLEESKYTAQLVGNALVELLNPPPKTESGKVDA